MKNDNLHHFKYKYNEGPLLMEELHRAIFTTGNCRRAIQDYLYCKFGLYLEPEKILLPEGYLKTGTFITRDEIIDFSLYKPGDIIYAEKIRDKNNKVINKGKSFFKTGNEWIVSLHSAIFVDDNLIYHATAITEQTCYWSVGKFKNYYKIVAVKRVITG